MVLLVYLGVGSFLGSIDPAWIALIGTVFGGVGLKVIDHFFSKNRNKNADTREARRDLLGEMTELVNRVDKLEDEVTLWRDRYYAEQEKVAILRYQVIQLGKVPADNIAVMVTDDEGNIKDTYTA